MNVMRRLNFLLLAFLMPLAGCNCQGDYDSGWVLEDDWPFEADVVDATPGPDVAAEPDAVGPPDTWPQADIREDDVRETDAHEEPWQPEEVEPSIPGTHALTDRTSLAVDPEGTLWLGYHACNDYECSRPMLRVVHKKIGQDWVGEDIRAHEGIFGVSVVKPGEPLIAYPDSFEAVYRADLRAPNGQWRTHTFDVPRGSSLQYDGFDIAQDGDSYFISFAPNDAPEVSFYGLNVRDAQPRWKRLQPLQIRNSQAAMERGLRADRGNSVYLVNRNGSTGLYGVYRYDETINRWPQSVEFDAAWEDLFVHSLYITRDYRLCMSGSLSATDVYASTSLMVTCGSMFDLTQEVHVFGEELLSPEHPSSIIEGTDGTLYVAYNPRGNRELRVASKRPGESRWKIETAWDGPSYGVSTAIDLAGDLVISFYTCDELDRCSLKVVWESMNQ